MIEWEGLAEEFRWNGTLKIFVGDFPKNEVGNGVSGHERMAFVLTEEVMQRT